jgi:hypothetical protein
MEIKTKTLTDKQKVVARGMNALLDLIDEGTFGPEHAEEELGKAYAAGIRHGLKQAKAAE